jgi:hypothetical protein
MPFRRPFSAAPRSVVLARPVTVTGAISRARVWSVSPSTTSMRFGDSPRKR